MSKSLAVMCFFALCGVCLVMTTIYAADEESSPVRASVESIVQYTDNRDAVKTDTESTFDVYVVPRIATGIDAQQTVVDFHVAPGIRYRSNPSTIDNEFQWLMDAGVDLQHSFTPTLKFTAKEQLDYTDDPSVQDGGQIVRGNQSYFLNRAEAALNWKFMPRWAADVYGRYSTKSYTESTVADVANEDRMECGTILWRQVARTVGVKAIGRYSDYAMPPLKTVSRDFNVLVGALGAEVELTPTLRAGAEAGWNEASYDSKAVGSTGGPYANLTLLGKVTQVFDLTGSLTHAIREADSNKYISQEYTEGRINAVWRTSSVVTLGLSGAVRFGEYDQQIASKSGDETTTSLLGEASFKVMPKGTVKVSQRYEDVSSDVTTRYQKNTSAISFVAAF